MSEDVPTAVRQAVFRVPDRSTGSVNPEDVTCRRPQLAIHAPNIRPSQDILGTWRRFGTTPRRENHFITGPEEWAVEESNLQPWD
jgi:hypothetical protein